MSVKVTVGGGTQILPNAKEINARIVSLLKDPPPSGASYIPTQSFDLVTSYLASNTDRAGTSSSQPMVAYITPDCLIYASNSDIQIRNRVDTFYAPYYGRIPGRTGIRIHVTKDDKGNPIVSSLAIPFGAPSSTTGYRYSYRCIAPSSGLMSTQI